MKPEEAIDGLRYMISGGCTDSHWDFIDEIELAIETLEKQIAKEPVIVTIQNVNYPTCPTCGRVLWGKEYYCATCGQRVNRGE